MTTFPAVQKIVVADIDGDLTIQGWEQATVQVESDDTIERLKQQGDSLLIGNTEGSVRLSVPHATSIVIKDVSGNIMISDISNTVNIKDIEDAVTLTNIGGNVTVNDIGAEATLSNIQGSVTLNDIGTSVVLSEINGSAMVKDIGSNAILKSIGGNVTLTDIGEDASVIGVNGSVTARDIGSDLYIENISGSVQASDIGTDLILKEIKGNVTLNDIGNDLSLTNIQGAMQIADIGNDAQFAGLQGSLNASDIGGDLQLLADFVSSPIRIYVSGDALVTIPNNANLTLVAAVSGNISGHSIASMSQGSRKKQVNLTYGTGQAYLELRVGGDLILTGDESPRSSSSSSSSSGFEFSTPDFGPDMDNMGRDISETVSKLNVRINDREWRLDPERLDRLVEQAKRAAADGVQGALEAVEQALSNLRMPPPQTAPKPPVPPMPPVAPTEPAARTMPMSSIPPTEPIPPMEPMKPMKPMEPMKPMQPMEPMNAAEVSDEQPIAASTHTQTQTQRMAEVEPTPPLRTTPVVDPTQERMAILRMISEGRITPDEGDLLLEALGN